MKLTLTTEEIKTAITLYLRANAAVEVSDMDFSAKREGVIAEVEAEFIELKVEPVVANTLPEAVPEEVKQHEPTETTVHEAEALQESYKANPETLVLGAEDAKAFVDALEAAPKVNNKFMEAAKRHKELTESGDLHVTEITHTAEVSDADTDYLLKSEVNSSRLLESVKMVEANIMRPQDGKRTYHPEMSVPNTMDMTQPEIDKAVESIEAALSDTTEVDEVPFEVQTQLNFDDEPEESNEVEEMPVQNLVSIADILGY